MNHLAPSTALRVLGALSLVAALGGCGLSSLDGEGPPERQPPDSGPPVGGQDVIDWHGDAAVDPSDAGADGGGLFDGGAIDGGEPGEPPCGTLSNLADDFASAPRTWMLDAVGAAQVRHSDDDYIRFELPEGSTPESGHGRLVGRWTTSLRHDLLHLEFARLAPWLVTSLTLVGPDDAGELLRIHHHDGSYRASLVSTAESVNASAERLLDEAHPHWRVRHTDDEQVRLEVSVDGSEWVELLSAPAPSWIDHVRPILQVHGEDTTQADLVVLDEVRGRRSSPSWCPLGTLHEPFEAPLSPAWQTDALQRCDAVVDDGALSLAQSTNGNLDCSLRSSSPLAHHGQTLVLKLTAWPAPALVDTFGGLHLILGDTHELYFGIRAGSLRATVQQLDGADAASAPTQPAVTSPLYLQLELLEDGDARFSYGADGETFTPLWTHALPAVSDVRLGLALKTFGDGETSTTDGATLRVEGLNAE